MCVGRSWYFVPILLLFIFLFLSLVLTVCLSLFIFFFFLSLFPFLFSQLICHTCSHFSLFSFTTFVVLV